MSKRFLSLSLLLVLQLLSLLIQNVFSSTNYSVLDINDELDKCTKIRKRKSKKSKTKDVDRIKPRKSDEAQGSQSGGASSSSDGTTVRLSKESDLNQFEEEPRKLRDVVAGPMVRTVTPLPYPSTPSTLGKKPITNVNKLIIEDIKPDSEFPILKQNKLEIDDRGLAFCESRKKKKKSEKLGLTPRKKEQIVVVVEKPVEFVDNGVTVIDEPVQTQIQVVEPEKPEEQPEEIIQPPLKEVPDLILTDESQASKHKDSAPLEVKEDQVVKDFFKASSPVITQVPSTDTITTAPSTDTFTTAAIETVTTTPTATIPALPVTETVELSTKPQFLDLVQEQPTVAVVETTTVTEKKLPDSTIIKRSIKIPKNSKFKKFNPANLPKDLEETPKSGTTRTNSECSDSSTREDSLGQASGSAGGFTINVTDTDAGNDIIIEDSPRHDNDVDLQRQLKDLLKVPGPKGPKSPPKSPKAIKGQAVASLVPNNNCPVTASVGQALQDAVRNLSQISEGVARLTAENKILDELEESFKRDNSSEGPNNLQGILKDQLAAFAGASKLDDDDRALLLRGNYNNGNYNNSGDGPDGQCRESTICAHLGEAIEALHPDFLQGEGNGRKVLNPKYNRAYGGAKDFGKADKDTDDEGNTWRGGCNDGVDRGDLPYFTPEGWVRLALNKDDKDFNGTQVLYHGTDCINICSILNSGLSKKAQCDALKTKKTPLDAQECAYMSSSIEYCALPRYAKVFYNDVTRKYIQFVMECRYKPPPNKDVNTFNSGDFVMVIPKGTGDKFSSEKRFLGKVVKIGEKIASPSKPKDSDVNDGLERSKSGPAKPTVTTTLVATQEPEAVTVCTVTEGFSTTVTTESGTTGVRSGGLKDHGTLLRRSKTTPCLTTNTIIGNPAVVRFNTVEGNDNVQNQTITNRINESDPGPAGPVTTTDSKSNFEYRNLRLSIQPITLPTDSELNDDSDISDSEEGADESPQNLPDPLDPLDKIQKKKEKKTPELIFTRNIDDGTWVLSNTININLDKYKQVLSLDTTTAIYDIIPSKDYKQDGIKFGTHTLGPNLDPHTLIGPGRHWRADSPCLEYRIPLYVTTDPEKFWISAIMIRMTDQHPLKNPDSVWYAKPSVRKQLGNNEYLFGSDMVDRSVLDSTDWKTDQSDPILWRFNDYSDPDNPRIEIPDGQIFWEYAVASDAQKYKYKPGDRDFAIKREVSKGGIKMTDIRMTRSPVAEGGMRLAYLMRATIEETGETKFFAAKKYNVDTLSNIATKGVFGEPIPLDKRLVNNYKASGFCPEDYVRRAMEADISNYIVADQILKDYTCEVEGRPEDMQVRPRVAMLKDRFLHHQGQRKQAIEKAKECMKQFEWKFLIPMMWEFEDPLNRNLKEIYLIEEYIEGHFMKWSNNIGWVNEEEIGILDDGNESDSRSFKTSAQKLPKETPSDIPGLSKEVRKQASDVIHTLTHWSHLYTKSNSVDNPRDSESPLMLLVDLQGWILNADPTDGPNGKKKIVLTDPIIHSRKDYQQIVAESSGFKNNNKSSPSRALTRAKTFGSFGGHENRRVTDDVNHNENEAMQNRGTRSFPVVNRDSEPSPTTRDSASTASSTESRLCMGPEDFFARVNGRQSEPSPLIPPSPPPRHLFGLGDRNDVGIEMCYKSNSHRKSGCIFCKHQ